MRAWQVDELGDPAAVLKLVDVEQPEPSKGQVRVKVTLAALNYADDLIVRGQYQEKPPLPFTPGMEVVGVVDSDGTDAPGLAVGDRVVALTAMPSGGLAEFCVADASTVFPVPASMPDSVAASLLVTYQTAHIALHRRARLRTGETLLVHAGAGGIGSAAIQLGVAAGARVVATAGGPEKVALCRELGAEVALDYRTEDFVEMVKGATDGRGADVIFDSVGGDVFDGSRRCIAWEGRIVIIGFSGGRIADAPTNHVLLKNYDVIGVHWSAYRDHDRRVMSEAHGDLVRLYESGAIEPLVDRTVPLSQAADALRAVASRGTVGKVLVDPTR